MKKTGWILSGLLVLTVGLTACGTSTETKETLHPIDAAAWPTPVAQEPTPLPTPFPKISMKDVAPVTDNAAMAAIENEEAVEQSTEFAMIENVADKTQTKVADVSGVPQTVSPKPVSTGSGSLSVAGPAPATSGTITISAVNVRQGPSTNYGKLGYLTEDTQVGVLAINPKKDWVLVQSNNLTGWMSLDYLKLSDGLSGVPAVLSSTPDNTPSGKIASIFAAAGVRNQELGIRAQGSGDKDYQPVAVSYQQAAAGAPKTVLPLVPVAATTLSVNKTDVRPGPGPSFEAIGELSDPLEAITILGVDPARQWALVAPQHGHSKVGWVLLDDLNILDNVISTAPEVYTGWTNSNALALRAGPGIFNDEVGRLPINNIVRVMGLNEGRSWALIQPVPGGGEGWTQIQYLTFSNKISNMPIAPAPPPVEAPEPINPALSAASAKEGMLAIQLASGGQIVTLAADGSGLKTATHGIDPSLSPDGAQLAFTRWEGGEAGNGTLWVKDLATGSEQAVLGFLKQPKGAEWSPDGSQIVLNYQHGGRLNEKNVTVDLTKHSGPNIPWNASDVNVRVKNGVPFLKYTLPPDPYWGLRVVNVADGSYEDMDGGTYAFRPAWDTLQDWRIVSDGGAGLVETDVNRKDFQQKITGNRSDSSPVFSPDGQYLAVAAGGGNGYDIFRLNRDGTARQKLTDTPLWVAVTPDGEGRRWNNVSPAWSPDGSQIAYLTDRTGRWEVWVMNVDGTNPRPMFPKKVNSQLNINYNFVDERVISWR